MSGTDASTDPSTDPSISSSDPAGTASEAHGRQVRAMFGQVAGRYDLMNRLMTFGQDVRWRRFVIGRAGLRPGERLLDLATGTGDLAFDALAQTDNLRVAGADFTVEMMRVGRRRPGAERMNWLAADALALPFADASFDAVIQGYLLRNLVDIPTALAEQYRVLRPGGRIVVLETSPPPRSPVRPLVNAHMRYGIPMLSRLVSGSPEAYGYLLATTARFRSPSELVMLLHDAGFEQVQWRSFMFGTQAVHWARKPGGPDAAASAGG